MIPISNWDDIQAAFQKKLQPKSWDDIQSDFSGIPLQEAVKTGVPEPEKEEYESIVSKAFSKIGHKFSKEHASEISAMLESPTEQMKLSMPGLGFQREKFDQISGLVKSAVTNYRLPAEIIQTMSKPSWWKEFAPKLKKIAGRWLEGGLEEATSFAGKAGYPFPPEGVAPKEWIAPYKSVMEPKAKLGDVIKEKAGVIEDLITYMPMAALRLAADPGKFIEENPFEASILFASALHIAKGTKKAEPKLNKKQFTELYEKRALPGDVIPSPEQRAWIDEIDLRTGKEKLFKKLADETRVEHLQIPAMEELIKSKEARGEPTTGVKQSLEDIKAKSDIYEYKNSGINWRESFEDAWARIQRGEFKLTPKPKEGEKPFPEKVVKYKNNGTMPVFEGEAMSWMNPSIPDIKIGGIEAYTTPSYYTMRNHPVTDKLRWYADGKRKAWVLENQYMREEFTSNWKQRLSKSGYKTHLASKRIHAYLESQDPHGKAGRIARGEPIVELRDLGPIDIDIVGDVRQVYDSMFERVNKARELAGQKPIPYVENYYTLMRNMEHLKNIGINIGEAPLDILEPHLSATAYAFGKKRVGSTAKTHTDFFDNFDRYVHETLRHIHITPVIAKGRALLEPFRVPAEIDGKPSSVTWTAKYDKPKTAQLLNSWLNNLAGHSGVETTFWKRSLNKFASYINKSLSMSILSANIRSALIQPSALRGAYAEVGRYLAEGLADNLLPNMRNFAMRNSRILESRNFDIHMAEMIDPSTRGRIARAKRAISEKGIKPLQFLDMETARAAWLGAYKHGVKELGLELKEAIRHADDIVLKTQASAQPEHISIMQRTPMGRMFSMFQTFTINEWNYIMRDLMGIKNPERNFKQNIPKAIRFTLGTLAVNALTEGAIGMQSPFPAPEWEIGKMLSGGETNVGKLAVKGVKELGEQMPIIGGTMRWSTEYRTAFPAAVQIFVDLQKVSDKIASGSFDKITIFDMEALGKILGLPGTSQVRKYISRRKNGMGHLPALLGVRSEMKKEISGNNFRKNFRF